MVFAITSTGAMAQPWQPRMTFADFDGDGELDAVEAITVWDSLISAESVAKVTLMSAGGTTIRQLSAPVPGVLFGDSVVAVEDADEDGVADVLVTAPMETTATGRGRVYLISGATGAVIASVIGPQNMIFGASLRATRNIRGDGKTDVAIAALAVDAAYNVRVVWRAYSGSSLTSLGSGLTTACQSECVIGTLVDANADEEVSQSDAVEILLAEGTVGAEAVMTDVNGDGITDVVDTQAALLVLVQPAPASCPSPLPTATETLVRMLGMPIDGSCAELAFVDVIPQAWNTSTSSCVMVQPAGIGSPCSGTGCLWRGAMSWRYWGAFPLLSGLGSIRGDGFATDSTNCGYHIRGYGSLSLGGGGLLGRASATLHFSGLAASCQWPFDVGSRTLGGYVGIGGIGAGGMSVSLFYPMAEMGQWDVTGENPLDGPSFTGAAFGAGAVQGEVKHVTRWGPGVLINPALPPIVPCVP